MDKLDAIETQLAELRSEARKTLWALPVLFVVSIGSAVWDIENSGNHLSWIAILALLFGLLAGLVSLNSRRKIRVLEKKRDLLLEGRKEFIEKGNDSP